MTASTSKPPAARTAAASGCAGPATRAGATRSRSCAGSAWRPASRRPAPGSPSSRHTIISHLRRHPSHPPPCAPPDAAWQAAADAFLWYAFQQLYGDAGDAARSWLAARGLDETTIATACLGYNPTPLLRPRARWGLPPDDAGRTTLWLPAGIVIPTFVDGALWKLSIRQDDRRRAAGPTYHSVPGSANALYHADALRPGAPALLCEGVFDALAVAQVAGDLVAAVAAGTSGARRVPWIARLAVAAPVLVALDADAAGEAAAAYWLDVLAPTARRWRPLFDDPAAMLQAGLDLRQWVAAGLQASAGPPSDPDRG